MQDTDINLIGNHDTPMLRTYVYFEIEHCYSYGKAENITCESDENIKNYWQKLRDVYVYMNKNSLDAEDLEQPIKKDFEFVKYYLGGQSVWNDLYVSFAPNEITFKNKLGLKSN